MRLRRTAASAGTALILGMGLLAGLGAGAASGGHRNANATTPATTATIPEPVVTTVTQPVLPAARLPGTGKPPVHLGDGNTPEQFVIGQLYEVALQQRGYQVILNRNATAPAQQRAGLRRGSLDVFPEYVGEWNSAIAHLHRRFRTLNASFGAARAYARRHGFVLLPPTPFSDTSCVAVLAQYAAANHIYSLPALARSGPVIFGAPLAFQIAGDGVPALERAYHLRPYYPLSISAGLQYGWLSTGNVQAAYCATTDPELAGPRYVELRDPKHIFGHGNVVPVTTPRVLRLEGPVFRQTLERIDSLLTLRAMRGLNAEYQQGGHYATQIAKQFLQGNGILPPSRYAPVPITTSPTGTAPAGS